MAREREERWRDGVSWPAFLASQRDTRAPVTDALLIVQRWLGHIPAEQIHVITVPPAGTGPAVLLGRFSDAFGIDTTKDATIAQQRYEISDLRRRLAESEADEYRVRVA